MMTIYAYLHLRIKAERRSSNQPSSREAGLGVLLRIEGWLDSFTLCWLYVHLGGIETNSMIGISSFELSSALSAQDQKRGARQGSYADATDILQSRSTAPTDGFNLAVHTCPYPTLLQVRVLPHTVSFDVLVPVNSPDIPFQVITEVGPTCFAAIV